MWHWCNLAAKESGLEWAWLNNDDFTVLVSEGDRCPPLSEHGCCRKLFRRFTMGTSKWQLHHDNTIAYASRLVQSFFGTTSNHPGDSAPLRPRFGTLRLLAFLRTKITFEREEIVDCQRDSGKFDGAAEVIGKTVWGPKVPTLKGTEVSLSYVQCFLYLFQ